MQCGPGGKGTKRKTGKEPGREAGQIAEKVTAPKEEDGAFCSGPYESRSGGRTGRENGMKIKSRPGKGPERTRKGNV